MTRFVWTCVLAGLCLSLTAGAASATPFRHLGNPPSDSIALGGVGIATGFSAAVHTSLGGLFGEKIQGPKEPGWIFLALREFLLEFLPCFEEWMGGPGWHHWPGPGSEEPESPIPAPEPGTLFQLAGGLALLAAGARRRRAR